jgi:hypothetical protein
MLPGRRAILSGAVGASLGAAGMFYGSERASAQAAGQVGTSSNPVDVQAFSLAVQNGADLNGSDLNNVGSLGVESELSVIDSTLYAKNGNLHQETRTITVPANGTTAVSSTGGRGSGIVALHERQNNSAGLFFVDRNTDDITELADSTNSFASSPGVEKFNLFVNGSADLVVENTSSNDYDVNVYWNRISPP